MTLGLVGAFCLAATACSPDSSPSGGGSDSELVRVPQDAPSIQAALDKVVDGGMVLVDAGVYRESVVVSTKDVTVRGADRDRIVIDGEGLRPYGVVGIADGVRVQNLTVRNHTFYGVLITGVHDKKGPSANNGDDYDEFEPASSRPCSGSRSTT